MSDVLVARAFELSAVSGFFEPDTLCKAIGVHEHPKLKQEVLRQLSSAVSETCDQDPIRYGWFLLPDERLNALRQLLTGSQLEHVLANAPKPWPEDVFGSVLRQILSGKGAKIAVGRGRESDDDLLAHLRHNAAILDATQFAREIPAVASEMVERLERQAKRQIQLLQRRRDLTTVLPRRHFGYDAIRRRLSNFLRGGTVESRPVLLTGTGGIGKSAVLARMLQTWQSRKDAPVTIILDFDRPRFKSGSPFEIAREFLNQLATGVQRTIEPASAATEIARKLRDLRSNLISSGTGGEQRDHGSQAGFLESVIPTWFEENWANPLRMQPIAMAFDSFEAVDRQGGEVVRLIMDVERRLRSQLPELRTVLSGRAAPLPEEELEEYFGSVRRQFNLDGLDEHSGALLLEEEDIRLAGETGEPVLRDEDMRRNVSRILLGHPLALLIFAQYAQSHTGDVTKLVDDLERDRAFQAEFAHRFLYERILDRIDDDDVRKLAHPGLVLRQINEDLIRFVLAEPCLDLPADTEMEQARVTKLREKLENEYWLVEPGEEPFPLRHRPDVRRLMVSGLFAAPRDDDTPGQVERKEKLRDDALTVCRAAQSYFLNGPPETAGQQAKDRWNALDDALRRTEALYYGAFLAPDMPDAFDREMANELDLALGEDVETLPEAWRARIKVLLNRVLTQTEALNLPEDLVELASEQEFASAKQHGLSSSAADFSTISTSADLRREKSRELQDTAKPRQTSKPNTSQLSRDIQRAFSAAEFDEVSRLAPTFFEALHEDPGEEDLRSAFPAGYWQHPFWQCLLVSGSEVGPSLQIMEAAGKFDGTTLEAFLIDLVTEAPNVSQSVIDRLGHELNQAASHIDFLRLSLLVLKDWSSISQRTESFYGSATGDALELGFQIVPTALSLAAGRVADESLRQSFFASLPEFAGYLEKFWYNDRPYLSDFEGLYRQFSEERPLELRTDKPPSIADLHRRMFRGLNPDLYGPLRTVLMDQGDLVATELSASLAERAVYWPRELMFFDGAEYNRTQAATMIEVADRCGELRVLCNKLAKIDERADPVLRMYDKITAWFFPFAQSLET